MGFETSLYTVEAVILLDNTGKRLFAKYYKAPHEKAVDELIVSKSRQLQFEKMLFSKTYKQNSDVLLADNHTIVYKEFTESILYVVGSLSENEVLLYNVLQGLTGAFEILLNEVDKRAILENYDLVALAIDETIDDGVVLETDPSAIAARVTSAPSEDATDIKIDLSERGLMNVFNFTKKNITERLQQGF